MNPDMAPTWWLALTDPEVRDDVIEEETRAPKSERVALAERHLRWDRIGMLTMLGFLALALGSTAVSHLPFWVSLGLATAAAVSYWTLVIVERVSLARLRRREATR